MLRWIIRDGKKVLQELVEETEMRRYVSTGYSPTATTPLELGDIVHIPVSLPKWQDVPTVEEDTNATTTPSKS